MFSEKESRLSPDIHNKFFGKKRNAKYRLYFGRVKDVLYRSTKTKLSVAPFVGINSRPTQVCAELPRGSAVKDPLAKQVMQETQV